MKELANDGSPETSSPTPPEVCDKPAEILDELHTSGINIPARTRSVDASDSENQEPKEEELGVLPHEAVQILQSETWKRSLPESLSQAKNGEAVQENKSRWGHVVATRPATRGHGNINIMEKAAAYKRKKNLEIPPTFKGKSFSTMDKIILTNQMSQMNLVIGGMTLKRILPLMRW